VELPKLNVWQNSKEQTKNKFSVSQLLHYKTTAGDALIETKIIKIKPCSPAEEKKKKILKKKTRQQQQQSTE